MKIQVVKCKTCNRVFAACVEEHIDDEWKEECDKYVKEGNSVVETVESTKGNVFGDEPLNPCCGKPLTVTGTMKPTLKETQEAAKKHCNQSDSDAGRRIARMAGFVLGSDWGYEKAISQVQPEWVSVTDRLPEADGTYLIINTFGGMMVWMFQDKEWKKYGYGQIISHWMPLPSPPKTT